MSRIASGFGTPLCADECTSRMERIFYARLLIEIDITSPLPKTIKVVDSNGEVFDQAIEYEWWPQYCPTCCQIGHICNVKPLKQAPKQNKPKQTKNESKQNQQIWINKQDQPAAGTETVTHTGNEEGWKQVKGKSASKRLVVTSQEED